MGDENDVDRIKDRAQQDAADHYEANKFSCLAIREMVYQDRERLIELYEQQKQQLATVTEQRDRAVGHVKKAAEIIELGDQRLTAQDGPCGNQPPDISLDEWKQLYQHLQKAIAEARGNNNGKI